MSRSETPGAPGAQRDVPNIKMKALFVGLGGTGKRVLADLKRKFRLVGIDTATYPQINLLCIDFDDAPEWRQVEINGNKETVQLDVGEYLFLPTDVIQERIRDIGHEFSAPYYESWYPDMDSQMIRFGIANSGAAQWRPLGRVGFFEHADQIHATLHKRYADLMHTHASDKGEVHNDPVFVYVISSISGGTGAGMLLDILYSLRELVKGVPIFSFLVLPDVYKDWDRNGRLYANSYGVLKELNAFITQDYPFKVRYPDGEDIDVRKGHRSPVDMVYLFDEQIGESTWATPRELSEYVAESMFTDVIASSMSDEQASYLTNLTGMTGKVKFDKLSERCVFNVVGTTSIILPKQSRIRAYLASYYGLERLIPAIEIGLGNPDEMLVEEMIKALDPNDRKNITANLKTSTALIENTKSELERLLSRWKESLKWSLARRVYGLFGAQVLSEDHCKRVVEDWTEMFLGLGENANMRSKLPDEEGKGFESKLADFNIQLRTNIQALQQEGKRRLEIQRVNAVLYKALHKKAYELRSQYRIEQEALIRKFNDPESVYARIVTELTNVIRARPWSFMTELALRSVLYRLFNQALAQPYQDVIKRIHVNSYLAESIELAIRDMVEKDALEWSKVQSAVHHIRGVLENTRHDFEHEIENNTQTLTENYVSGSDFITELRGMVDPYDLIEDDRVLTVFEEYAERHGQPDILLEGKASAVADTFLSFSWQLLRDGIDDEELDPLKLFVQGSYRDEFTSYLLKAKNIHFLTHYAPNENDERAVFISIPRFSSASDENGVWTEKLGHLIDHVFDSPNVHPVFMPEADRLMVKFVSLNHPTYNLQGIGKMYRNYEEFKTNKKLFHTDRRYVSLLPEVYIERTDETEPTVYCGNEGCDYNIIEVSRSVILCPGCRRPIRCRCGNLECTADELHIDYPSLAVKPVRKCPVCEEKLLTYWNWCERHNAHYRTDAIHCPDCIDEYNDHKITFDEVDAIRGVSKSYKCPGCVQEDRPNPSLFHFRNVYYEVKPEQAQEANGVFEADLAMVDRGVCKQCYSTLLPVCPHLNEEEREKQPHYVSRNDEGHLTCTHSLEHARLKIYECGVCGFPLRDEDQHCRRCHSKLQGSYDELERIKYPTGFPGRIVGEDAQAYEERISEELQNRSQGNGKQSWSLFDEWKDAIRRRNLCIPGRIKTTYETSDTSSDHTDTEKNRSSGGGETDDGPNSPENPEEKPGPSGGETPGSGSGGDISGTLDEVAQRWGL